MMMIANYTISVHYRQFNYRWVPSCFEEFTKERREGADGGKRVKGEEYACPSVPTA